MSARSALGVLLIALVTCLSATEARAEGTLRTVLVIDASSSMLKTDPNEVRKVAAEIFVDLARDGDEIAVTGFDDGVRESTGGFTKIRAAADRASLKRAVRAVGKDGAWTNFGAGLGEARRMLDAAQDEPGDQEMIVFLTDGKYDPDPRGPIAEAARAAKQPTEKFAQDKLLAELVPSLGTTRLYAIGLSRGAPRAFLDELAKRTGGAGVTTEKADELPALFAGIYTKLLGSKMTALASKSAVALPIDDGLLSLDVVLVGKPELALAITGPGGPVPTDNRDETRAHFSTSDAYRHFKITKPAAGSYAVAVGGPGAGGTLVALEHYDLGLKFLDLPEVVEVGGQLELRLALATSANKTAPFEFLDRHVFALRAAGAREGCLEELRAQRATSAPVPIARAADGTYVAKVPAPAKGELCFEATVAPGPGGVLSRRTTSRAVLVVPPMKLAAKPVAFAPVKQDDTGVAKLDLEGSQIGLEVKAKLAWAEGGEGLELEPREITLSPGKREPVELRVKVDRDAPAQPRPRKFVITPVKPTGYEGRALTVEVELRVIPLTFWERYGFWISVGAGGLVLLVLVAGFALPARFPRRMVLHWRDARDPDLPRTGSYPVGVKAKAGFFRGARLELGPTGPVRKGGVVELRALAGGAISAAPKGQAVELPREDESGQPLLGQDPRDVRLVDGQFRVAPGARYEIKNSGLSFWCTVR